MPIPKGKRARRHLFTTVGTTVFSLVAVVLLVGFVFIGNGIRTGSGLTAAVISSILVDLANEDRSSNDIGALTVNPLLVAAAQAKADDMAAKGYFAHNSPDGKSPWYWFRQVDYKFSYAGENLAINFSDSSDVEEAWMNSPKHRENILNAHFTEVGIATAVGYYEGRKTTFVVQAFGTPAKVTPTQPVTPITVPEKPTDIAIATTQEPEPAPVVAAATVTPTAPTAVAAATTKNTGVLGEAAPTPLSENTGLLARIWKIIMGSPKVALQYSYYGLGAFVLLALLIETGLEIRRHHVRHAAIAIVLVVLILGLFSVASSYLFSTPVLAAPATLSV